MPNTAKVRAAIPRQSRDPGSRRPVAGLDDPAHLETLVTTTWQQRLGIVLRPAHHPVRTPYAVSAAVTLTGCEVAAVALSMPHEVAAFTAGAALGLRLDEVASGDIDDVLSDMVVALATELCHPLPGVTAAAPLIVHGEGVSTSSPGARRIGESTLRSPVGPVHVSVWAARRLPMASAG